jgi:DNA polymerase-3 subunit epsilon
VVAGPEPVKTWADEGMVSFDTETTGLDPEHARIVTASLVYVHPGEPPAIREWLADPGIDIPIEASDIHGVTTDHARAHGRPHDEVVVEGVNGLFEYVAAGVPVVVFNAPYDLTLLDRAARRAEYPSLSVQAEEADRPLYVIDPLCIDRKQDPFRRGTGVRKLTYLCQRVYGVALSDEEAHGSTADALAAARVAWKIARRFPAVGRLPLGELQVLQKSWHQEWAREFGLWLRRSGRPDDTDFHWPLRPPPGEPGLFDAAPPAVDVVEGR